MTGRNAEPGGRLACSARSNDEMPKLNPPTIARMRPLTGFMTSMPPLTMGI